ncbi:hypothetical protein [Arthrobacter sp. NPDC058127]|uniref:hypothetical protein n=1 Tax=Arthrobacter sp. NPDC058127 TaxID=3346351 RepID=UPI0036EC175E
MVLSNNRRATPLTFADSPYTAQPIVEDYIHAKHPETGLDEVFVPGEAKPSWLVEQEQGHAAAAEVQAEPVARRKGNKAATASREEGLT